MPKCFYGYLGNTKPGIQDGLRVFYCPACDQQRQYTQKTLRRYFTLYFIPLFPNGKAISEFVKYQYCNHQFASTVPPDQTKRAIGIANCWFLVDAPKQTVIRFWCEPSGEHNQQHDHHLSGKLTLVASRHEAGLFLSGRQRRMMKLAIVGASGAVGAELLKVLEKSTLQFESLDLYASNRSAGTKLKFKNQEPTVQLMPEGPINADVILASAGGSISKQFAPVWAKAGAVVIDNSSAFRYEENVPLVIPEINGDVLNQKNWSAGGIVANPNCTTAVAVMALNPIHKKYGIKRAIVSTYQATSGAGAKGMQELLEQTKNSLEGKEVTNNVFAHSIVFNVIPHIDVFLENAYTKEEMKVAWETRKILRAPDIKISCTAVRIPTLRTHSEAISLELAKPANPNDVRQMLAKTPGVELRDDPNQKLYPMPLTASGKYDVEVGRIRASEVFDGGLELFVAGDQLLKGAALNAVQIAEYMQAQGLLKQ